MLYIKLKGKEHIVPCKYIFCPYIRPWPWGSKGQTIFLLKEVMLHIQFKDIEHRTSRKDIFCPYTRPHPWDWVKTFFSELGHYQIKGNGA